MPPFSAAGAAMRFDMGGIDGELVGRPRQRRRQFGEHVLPYALLGPSIVAIVNGRGRTVLGRAVLPATTGLQHMDDAADHAPVINPPTARCTVR